MPPTTIRVLLEFRLGCLQENFKLAKIATPSPEGYSAAWGAGLVEFLSCLTSELKFLRFLRTQTYFA